MTNTNCLEGMSCPDCGSEEPFRIQAEVTVKMYDSGSDNVDGDITWSGDNTCTCVECGYLGPVVDFRDNEDESEDADCP